LSGNDFSGYYFCFGDWVIASREESHSKTAIEINCEPLAAPGLELIQASVCVAVHCPRDLTRGEGGVKAAAARPGESDLLLSLGLSLGDQSAEAKYPEKSLPDNRS
jgi:hypothetical protein